MEFQIKKVNTHEDLLKAFFVRSIVFCEEQGCSYAEEFDELDFSSIHFRATVKDEPIAVARLRLFKEYTKIERLAVRLEYRKMNIGKEMFLFVLSNHYCPLKNVAG